MFLLCCPAAPGRQPCPAQSVSGVTKSLTKEYISKSANEKDRFTGEAAPEADYARVIFRDKSLSVFCLLAGVGMLAVEDPSWGKCPSAARFIDPLFAVTNPCCSQLELRRIYKNLSTSFPKLLNNLVNGSPCDPFTICLTLVMLCTLTNVTIV